VDTGFLKVDGSLYPRSKYFTGNVLTALIEADTWDSNGQKRYGLMQVNLLGQINVEII
jgi:hypothetical protein